MKFNPIYKQTKTGKIQQWVIEVDGNRYRTTSGQTDGKQTVSEWTVVYGKNEGRSNATTDVEQALKEASAIRNLKLELDYVENIQTVGEQKYFQPMLAAKWEDVKDKVVYPIYSQPKLDGIRCIVNKDGMWSRNGKPILSAPHIFSALKTVFDEHPEYIFDGELYADKFANDFNKIVSLVKKTKPTAADLVESQKSIEYHIYDFPSCKKEFSTRILDLGLVFLDYEQIGRVCKLVSTQPVFSEESVMELYGNYVDEGYEGQMLRTDSPYENKRSKTLLKHKSFMDEEFTVLDIVEGEGNRTGTAGYFVFQTKDGKGFKSNVKGTFEETGWMLENKGKLIGKSATVKYFNLTPDGIPRFPYVINIGREEYE